MMTIRNVDVIVSMVININDVNRTEWSPVRSVITQVITNQTTAKQESDLSITSMITVRIGRH